ncbi:hypothetical protein [Nocardia sp. NPDC051750]|uniref:hypothetical protein n=1 Tax=Nocardia sp. NPDC051750 TaxID=3364325 RepID=UPI0037AE30EA
MLCRTDCGSSGDVERLSQAHDFRVVYTVYTDTGPELAARIAVQHVLDHGAEVVVVPYLSDQEVRETRAWQAIMWFADLVTATGVLECGS